tara:strand:+ start:1193 stop:1423 length:231 start_codon:yes stop_codon:yes gene_type:complete
MKHTQLKQLIKEEIQKEIFSKFKRKTPEDIVNDLKIQFQIAYETGLESPGSYEDFDRIFWNKNKQDIVLALEKHLK